MSFPVLDVTGWELRGVEQRGVTHHDWLVDPASGDLHLWKPSEGARLVRREHWAEKCAGELARLLTVPCVEITLAVRAGVAGCLSRNVVRHGQDIVPGAHLLTEVDADLRPDSRGPSAWAYTVDNIKLVLDRVEAPACQPRWLPSAFDAFTGYVCFDALVLNRDRHAGNWMVLRRRDGVGPDRLSPLYDNASSLAMSMGEPRMRRL